MRIMYAFLLVLQIVVLLQVCLCDEDTVCDRRPLGTNAEALPPDNRFQLEVKDARNNQYIPRRPYEVRLFSRDNQTPFIAFTISLRGDTVENKDNPRKPIMLKTGFLELHPNFTNAVSAPGCEHTIIQSDITPKVEVKVMWTAPEKDNKCVTIYALVAVMPDVWYSFEGPLSKQVCEDRRKTEDMQPMENEDCKVCDEARYQLVFEGMWSHNTHPLMYPTAQELARFSDIVGASHKKQVVLYTYSGEATKGLKLLAEQGNTTMMELQILDSLTNDINTTGVRTLIKATAPPSPSESTIASFRVTRKHHLVSLVTAILPSPDWFLGVSNMELCDRNTQNWVPNATLNLYPLDAGTDSGKTFEAANEETSPAQSISSAVIAKNVNKEDIKPFARLLFQLVRTYSRNCPEDNGSTDEPGGFTGDSDGNTESPDRGGGEESYRPTVPPTTTTSEEPASIDPETEESNCPMTTWGDWQDCDSECIDGHVRGYQTRYRQHAVDPTPECIEKMFTEDFQSCSEECEEEQTEVPYDFEEEE